MRRLCLSVGVLATFSALALAAPKPQITDPRGDYPVPPGDIVSVTFSTVPKGIKEVMQIEMVLAAAPSTNTPYAYQVDASAEDCDFVAIYWGHPLVGVFSQSGVGCRASGSTLPEGQVVVKGTSIIFTVPLAGKIKRGVTLTDLSAATTPSGMLAFNGNGGDTATSTQSYTIGSDRKPPKR